MRSDEVSLPSTPLSTLLSIPLEFGIRKNILYLCTEIRIGFTRHDYDGTLYPSSVTSG